MENMKSYSGLFIVTPEKEEAIDAVKESIGSVISSNSGNVVDVNVIGKKKLTYPIRKQTEGIYIEVLFDATTESISKIMRQFQINTDILRALIDKK